MPKVNITRSQTRLPTRTNFGGFGQINFGGGAGEALQQLGASVSAFAGEKQADFERAEATDFLATSTIEAQTQLSQLAEQKKAEFAENPKGYAEAFTKDSRKVIEGILSQAPSEVARQSAQAQMTSYLIGGNQAALSFEREAIVADYSNKRPAKINSAANIVKTFPTQLDQNLENLKITHEADKQFLANDPKAMKDLHNSDREMLIDAALDGWAEQSIQPGGREVAIANIEDILSRKDVVDLFGPEEVENKLKEAYRTINALEDQAIDERDKKWENNYTALNETLTSIERSGAVYTDVLRAEKEIKRSYTKGDLGPAEYDKLMKRVITLDKKSEKRRELQGITNQVIDSSGKYNFNDPKHMEASQSHYERYMGDFLQSAQKSESVMGLEKISGPTPEQVRLRMSQFVTDYGVFPEKAAGELEQSMAVASPQGAYEAALAINEITKGRPYLKNVFSTEAIEQAAMIADTADGLAPEEASRLFERLRSPKQFGAFTSRRESFAANKKKFDKWYKPKTLNGIKYKELPPEVQDSLFDTASFMYAEETNLTEAEAVAKASARMSTIVGYVRDGNGKKRVMAYAPAAVYQDPRFDEKAINEQMEDLISIAVDSGGSNIPEGMREDFKNGYFIERDPTSDPERPVYTAMYSDKMGNQTVLENLVIPQEALDMVEELREQKRYGLADDVLRQAIQGADRSPVLLQPNFETSREAERQAEPSLIQRLFSSEDDTAQELENPKNFFSKFERSVRQSTEGRIQRSSKGLDLFGKKREAMKRQLMDLQKEQRNAIPIEELLVNEDISGERADTKLGGGMGMDVLNQEPIPHNKVIGHPSYKAGKEAIRAVESLEGSLTPEQKRVVELEGFVGVPYYDTKGIVTVGVGQTGEFMKTGFKEAFKVHEERTRDRIDSYDSLPSYLRAELVQADYRGDLGDSPTFRALFNQGKYKKAAEEFLNHAEYKDPSTPKQIKDRIKAVSDAVLKYARGANDRTS